MNPDCSRLARILATVFAGGLLCAAFTSCAEQSSKPEDALASPPARLVYAKGRIDIEGGLIRLAASRDGLVKEVAVEEGERVRAGAVLAVIDDRPARLALAVTQAELAQAQAALPGLEVRLAAAERELGRLEPLLASGLTTRADYDQARDQVVLLRAERAAAESAVATSAARLRAGEYEIEQRIVRAPLDGWIVKRQARPGDGVSTLNVTPLFVFAPDAPRIVRADLDERFVDQVSAGQAAEVVLEADETRVIPGRILRVGQVFGVKTPTGEPGERIDQRVVECVVSVEDQALRIGQRVLVRIKP
jgi:RND family efflux transporter MFP subunit